MPFGSFGLLAATQGLYEVLSGFASDDSGVQRKLECFAVKLFNPSTNQTEFVEDVANGFQITCDISVAGPVINGRDQFAAFGAADSIYYYFIWNGSVLATIASLNSPLAGGPTLPVSYRSWAYVSAAKLLGGATADIRQRGNIVTYETARNALTTAAGPIVATNLDFGTLVPDFQYAPLAPTLGFSNFLFNIRAGFVSVAAGLTKTELILRLQAGLNLITIPVYTMLAAETNEQALQFSANFVNVAGSAILVYLFGNETNAANIANRTLTIDVAGYTDPLYLGS